VADAALPATVALLAITASLPCYLYGAWIVLREEVVTWDVLVHHLRFVGLGLLLTTVPVVVWMVPRLIDRPTGLSAFHAVIGIQAYALLAFALTGIVRIFTAKRDADLYDDPGSTALSDLHEDADTWRSRLRIGVWGYLLLWIAAYIVGLVQYAVRYL
jgi:hypothetical protein